MVCLTVRLAKSGWNELQGGHGEMAGHILGGKELQKPKCPAIGRVLHRESESPSIIMWGSGNEVSRIVGK